MKQSILFLSFLTLITLTATAQPNERLHILEQMLQEQGFDMAHVQRSARGIEHRWTSTLYQSSERPHLTSGQWDKWTKEEQKAFLWRNDSIRALQQQRTAAAIDLIRSTFSTLAAEASESYMFELHNKECDTIRLSMAWRDSEHPLNTWRGDGGVYYSGGREMVSFYYQRPPELDWASGMYTHVFTEPYPEPMGDIKAFDGQAFQQAVVMPVAKRALKLKGAKKLPVYWRHDESYKENGNEHFLYKVTHYTDYSANKHTGITTGEMYFIPKTLENEATELLATLDSLTYNYVTEHYDQDYTYRFNPRFYINNLTHIVSGSNWPDKSPIHKEYMLNASRDEDGYYILFTTTEGEPWVPEGFTKLKSWINGKAIYLKDKKIKEKR